MWASVHEYKKEMVEDQGDKLTWKNLRGSITILMDRG